MTDGPTEREIQRVREALEQHDSELRDPDAPTEQQGDAASEDDEEDG